MPDDRFVAAVPPRSRAMNPELADAMAGFPPAELAARPRAWPRSDQAQRAIPRDEIARSLEGTEEGWGRDSGRDYVRNFADMRGLARVLCCFPVPTRDRRAAWPTSSAPPTSPRSTPNSPPSAPASPPRMPRSPG